MPQSLHLASPRKDELAMTFFVALCVLSFFVVQKSSPKSDPLLHTQSPLIFDRS